MSFEKEINQLENLTSALLSGNYFVSIDLNEFPLSKNLALNIKSLQKQIVSQFFEIQVAGSQVGSVSHSIEDLFNEQKFISKSLNEKSLKISDRNKMNQRVVEDVVIEANHAKTILQESQNFTKDLVAISQLSKENIHEQSKEILNVVHIIDAIAHSTKTTDYYLELLLADFKKITDIVTTVYDFSQQTFLVSVNASIEAARAGEHGKGFSVIANEIRRLAKDSSDSVDSIHCIIEELIQVIEKVTECNHTNKSNVELAVNHSNGITEDLSRIESSYDKVLDHISTIDQSSMQSLSALNQVSGAIEKSSESSREMSIGVDDIQKLIKKQYEQNNLIQDLEERLKDSYHSLFLVSQKLDTNLLKQNENLVKEKIESSKVFLKRLLQNTGLLTMEITKHRDLVDNVLKEIPFLEALWSNDIQGNFIYSNPPAGISNAKVRKWFNECLEGKTYISDIYISAISKNPCITLSMPIYRDHEIIGVLGADIGLQFE